ncbi:Cupredoxin [Chytriomyces sp. MP71]|nr:Cupredoxin [Chytriomyces sp. MP71]
MTLSVKTLAPDGVPKAMMVANGALDYTITVNKGDSVVVVVTNKMKVPTTLHWHGMYQTETPWMDGPAMVTQCPIKPGGTFTYAFNVGNQAGTYWWHAHYETQYVDGLRGPFIIRDPNDPYLSLYDEEIIVTLADHFIQPAKVVLANYLDALDPAPDSGLINGRGQANCDYVPSGKKCDRKSPVTVFKVSPAKKYRLRVINMSAQAGFQVSIDGHNMTIIEADGVYTNPTVVSSFPIVVAQRYSVLVTADQPIDNYFFRATISDMYTPTGTEITNGVNFNCTAIWRYSSAPVLAPTTIPQNDIAPLNIFTLGELNGLTLSTLPSWNSYVYFGFFVTSDPQTNITISSVTVQSDKTNIYQNPYILPKSPTFRDIINGVALPEGSNIYENVNGWTFLQVRNNDNIEHTFHLHGHTFYVLAHGQLLHQASSLSTLPRRDSIQVPTCKGGKGGGEAGCTQGFVNLLVNFDHPGAWLFHCHVEWHMATGLAMTFVNRNGIKNVVKKLAKSHWDNCQSK